jgi:hypothetical protein
MLRSRVPGSLWPKKAELQKKMSSCKIIRKEQQNKKRWRKEIRKEKGN